MNADPVNRCAGFQSRHAFVYGLKCYPRISLMQRVEAPYARDEGI
jgi:hypothetical protein